MVSHVLPNHSGGASGSANVVRVCAACQEQLDRFRPSEREFVSYLATLVGSHPSYRNVHVEAKIGGRPTYVVDLICERRDGDSWVPLLVEAKNQFALSRGGLANAISQISHYREREPHRKPVLAIPTRLVTTDYEVLRRTGIQVWDLDFIAAEFAAQIISSPHPFYRLLFRTVAVPENRYLILLRRWKECEPGKENWYLFQKLVGEVVSALFSPPLEAPLVESPDVSGVNRRDFVYPNYAEDGFWRFLRDRYQADYVVVDAKNYRNKVSKQSALQIANYLKLHGAGLFSIIVCRSGPDYACLHTIREQWVAYRKMIVILGDHEIESMLLAASSGGKPEQVIGSWIQEFRLAL